MGGVATRPAFYAALLVAAALVNSSGYLFTLWHDETIFDEAVHFYTSFAVVAALGWLATGRPPFGDSAPSWWVFLVTGLVLGFAWEGIEWLTGIIGSRRDTAVDLLMDSLGAVAAAALVRRVCRTTTRSGF